MATTVQTRGVEALERRLARRGESLSFLQMIARTFASLELFDKHSIADTLSSMIATFTDAGTVFTLLTDDGESYRMAAGTGEVTEVTTPQAQGLWRELARERLPRRLNAAELDRMWPGRPAALAGGLASVTIELRDEPLGLVILGGKRSAEAFSDDDLDFLSGVVGIAAMALTNAESHLAQQALLADLERQAEDARRVADERARALAELDQKLEIIERQSFAIRELSTPVLQLWDGVLALPIIGVVDTRRSVEIMERLLAEVTEKQSRHVILDITGVEVVDTKTADHFIKVIKAAELLGTRCILTGIRPAVAQTLVDIGVDLSGVVTLRTLKDGLKECLRHMGANAAAHGA